MVSFLIYRLFSCLLMLYKHLIMLQFMINSVFSVNSFKVRSKYAMLLIITLNAIYECLVRHRFTHLRHRFPHAKTKIKNTKKYLLITGID